MWADLWAILRKPLPGAAPTCTMPHLLKERTIRGFIGLNRSSFILPSEVGEG